MKEEYEKILNEFYYDYWHILKDFGLSDFLQLLQLTVLTQYKNINVEKIISMAYNNFGQTEDRELYKQYIATNQKTGKFNQYDMDEYDNRESYINEAIKWIHRLDMEELRDIIYHHRLRDIQDKEYINNPRYIEQDNGIKWNENLVKDIINSNKTKKLLEQIFNEQDSVIELSADPLEKLSNEFYHKDWEKIGLKPQGNFAYMIEFFSTSLVCQEDDDYIGCFSEHDYNGKYIRDAMALINEVEKRAKELGDKYTDKGVKVTINDFNEGCQYGMAVYVWIPYQ